MTATIFYGAVFTDREYQLYIKNPPPNSNCLWFFNIMHNLYSESKLYRRTRYLKEHTSQTDPSEIASHPLEDTTTFGEKLNDLGYELRRYEEDKCLQFYLCFSLLKEHIYDGYRMLDINSDCNILIDDLNKAIILIQDETEKRVGIRPNFDTLKKGWSLVIDLDWNRWDRG